VLSADSALRAAFCKAEESESTKSGAYEEVVEGSFVVTAVKDPEYYIPSFKDRHTNGKLPGGGPNNILRVKLAFLRTCRQIYQEVLVILESTNIFAFEDGISFRVFLDTLNTAQRMKLKLIHLSMNVAIDARSMECLELNGHSSEETSQWKRAFQTARVGKLKGLRNLNVCIEQFHVKPWNVPTPITSEESRERVLSQVQPLFRFQTLPLDQVTVIVSDDIAPEKALMADRWTKDRKLALASQIKDKIHSPSGASVAAAEKQAKRTESERKKAEHLRAYPLLRARLAQEARTRRDSKLRRLQVWRGWKVNCAEQLETAVSTKQKARCTKELGRAEEQVLNLEKLAIELQEKADLARKIAGLVTIDPTVKYAEALAQAEEEVEEDEEQGLQKEKEQWEEDVKEE